MTLAATQAVLERPQHLHGLYHYGASFQDVSWVAPAPWLYSTLSQLWDLEHGGVRTRGVGDLRVSANTAVRARKILSKIASACDLPVPIVNVFSGGGITLSWQIGPREVKYTFWPEGVLSFWKEEEGQEVAGEELASDDDFDPRGPLGWLLSPEYAAARR